MGTPEEFGTDTHAPEFLAQIKFDDRGLVCAVAQQFDTGEVLMVAWMNAESIAASIRDGYATYWSRSRAELWRKGDTSGHLQVLKSISLDCDGDTLLLQVDQIGAACHTGARTCFTAGGLVYESSQSQNDHEGGA